MLAERLSQLQTVEVGEEQRQRLALLIDKLRNGQCVLAFCGHFSAGKSTLVNQLAGSPILPSSPIPTSANQVLIRHGQAGATVRFRHRGDLHLPPAELEQLSALCADGNGVEAVEIRHPLAHVPEGLWLMDTPGIDSTDGAHRAVTESALYLADAVFYVMDYNHVQSEVNLQFTRTLTEWGKPVYLIVNQIDKHVELELPFAQFRQSVLQAFAAWGVQPDGLFFTSLRQPDHPLNEWTALVDTIRRLGENREQLLLSGVWNSAVHLMEDAGRLREQAEATERAQLLQAAADGGPDPHLRRAVVAAELERLARFPEEAIRNLNREAAAILANAPLFLFGTKELAERYLESRQPNFRVGFFAADAKTRAEVERRLQALHADLAERVTAHIHWHLQNLFLRFGEAQAGRNEAYEAPVRALAVPLAPELLADLVKPQALIAREYLHQYIKDVMDRLQLLYRQAIKPLADSAALLAEARASQESEPLRAEEALLGKAIDAAQRLTAMQAAADGFRAAWSEILGENPAAFDAKAPDVADPPPEAPSPVRPEPLGIAHAQWDGAAAAPAMEGQALRADAASRLHEAARLLAPLPGMGRTAVDLEQRAQRLRESRFTVALFGAFSAGKSSFANALMGIQLLPVSPNPTTAVITRIAPPTPERPHGYVHVVWKQPEQLRREVDRALEALGLPATADLAADLATGARRGREATAPSAKPHAAFLAAAARGYGAVRQKLGQEEAAGLEPFASLVADEQRSCFVQEITVHVDCPVTRQGITLVDTPGADSINARHTDVAFDYIKNADAILFVTYYNHAFSRADREFLTQLGRVKDSFTLDKMFFLINAADLATDDAELELVAAHVRANLQACGIRQARIFPVSSQMALWSRLLGAGVLPRELGTRLGALSAGVGLERSGMGRFEAEFYRFVVTDLSHMAVDGAMAELRRASKTVASWVDAAREDQGARARRLEELRAAAARATALLEALEAGPEGHEVEREIDELLYYVRRRVLLERFRSGFADAFNSSVLRPDSPDLKRALREALHEVLQFVAFDLSQEMRATALRMEKVVNKQAERVAGRAASAISQQLPQWSGSPYQPVHLPIPAFSDGRDHLSPEPFYKLLGLFRSPERFFAGGGRHQLSDELSRALEEPVGGYLAAARTVLADSYGAALASRVVELKAELAAGVRDHTQGLTAALTGAGEVRELEALLERLQALLEAPDPDGAALAADD